jgi:hypothetical protein
MDHFWLIQKGDINKSGGPHLLKKNTEKGGSYPGIVDLSYMGASEFGWGAIPRAYARIMNSYSDYHAIDSQVPIVGNRKLILFAKKDFSEKIKEELLKFIKKPYQLQCGSELQKLGTVADISQPWTILRAHFWWCIDRASDLGDWMAFFEEDSLRILNALKHDYQTWWLNLSEKEREKLLHK